MDGHSHTLFIMHCTIPIVITRFTEIFGLLGVSPTLVCYICCDSRILMIKKVTAKNLLKLL